MSDCVRVVEVALRDGLQNETTVLSTQSKLALIDALVRARLGDIEVTSFVSPKLIPQLADAFDVASRLPDVRGVNFSALTPNAVGVRRARRAGLSHVAVFLSASRTHNLKNLHRTTEASLDLYRSLFSEGLLSGLHVRGYVSTVIGCAYEGDIAPGPVVELAEALLDMGCAEVSLGDTIGVGSPRLVRELVKAVASACPVERLALHLHDTRGLALANALAGLEAGIRIFDTSIAGLGGCPFAPGATGNLATEDLAWALAREGVETGLDLDLLWEAGVMAARLVGRPLPGKVHQAGVRYRPERV